jgi:hypothetical protein
MLVSEEPLAKGITLEPILRKRFVKVSAPDKAKPSTRSTFGDTMPQLVGFEPAKPTSSSVLQSAGASVPRVASGPAKVTNSCALLMLKVALTIAGGVLGGDA